jgi:hypothetical protein
MSVLSTLVHAQVLHLVICDQGIVDLAANVKTKVFIKNRIKGF